MLLPVDSEGLTFIASTDARPYKGDGAHKLGVLIAGAGKGRPTEADVYVGRVVGEVVAGALVTFDGLRVRTWETRNGESRHSVNADVVRLVSSAATQPQLFDPDGFGTPDA